MEEAPAELADEALKMVLVRRNDPKGCVHHSDSKNVAAGFAATAKEPYPAAGITLQHPDPHSDWRTARFGILTSTAIEPCHSLDMPVARGGPDGGPRLPGP